MKLALLGADTTTLDIVRAAIGRGDTVVWGSELGGLEPAVRDLVPNLRTGEGWEALLTGRVANAVVVAPGTNEQHRCEQLVKLAQEGVPLLLAHPLFGDPLSYYEIELAQREGGAAIVPFVPARFDPAVVQLRQSLSQEMTTTTSEPQQIGQPQQIVFERRLALSSSRTAREQFAHDVDLLRLCCGAMSELAAFGPQASDPATRELSLQMTSAGGTGIRWSCETSTAAPGGVLSVQGASGTTVLNMSDNAPWSLDDSRTEDSSGDSVTAVLDQLERATRGDDSSIQISDAIEAMTLVEAVDRSIRRSRTIQLRTDRAGERETFQATMSAWGCLLLGLLTLAVPGVALLVWLGIPLAQYIPHAAASVLVIFLLAQLLAWIIPREE
jgi:predicted dehydrogenase